MIQAATVSANRVESPAGRAAPTVQGDGSMTHETMHAAPHELAADARSPGVVAAIGAFDGLHRGHQILLREMVERAAAIGARTVCVTFDPDPAQVLHPGAPPRNLCSTAEREQLIR